jgi:hypothetical protein
MNDEKRPHPPLTDRLPGEERLSRLYQETTSEGPPPGLDMTVLDAARQAVRQKPRRVYFPASRKWTVPLSLAAAFVVTIGIARSLRHEMESPSSVSSPVGVRSSTPFRADERDEALHKWREQKQSQVEEAPGTTRQTMKPLGEMADEDTKTPVRRSTPKLTAPAERQERKEAPKFQAQEPLQNVPLVVQSPPPPVPAPAIVTEQEKANVGASTAKPQSQTPEQEYASQGSALRDEAAGTTSLRVSEDDLRSVGGKEKKAKTEMMKKDALPPEAWIAEIKKLRQAGKLTEAEASLKAFKQRYPDYPIEKALAR